MEDLVREARTASGQLTAPPEVVERDLDDICERAADELRTVSDRTVLVTGGAGFLGYYLVQAMLHWNQSVGKGSAPIRVVVVDNFLRGVPKWLTSRRGDPNLLLVEHDITDPLPPSVGSANYILHAASIASPLYYRKHPIETMDANVVGLRLLLEMCRERREAGRPVKGLLFFSSSEIYGDPDPANIPTPESYRGNVSCTGPRACYDESKRFGETMCVTFARVHELPVKVVRPFNNYGPGLRLGDRRVIPDFARDILEARDIVLLSDGTPTRTFCYVTDAVVGYFQALIRGRGGEAYNIGVEAPEVSIAQLADTMAEIAGELFGYQGRVVRKASSDPEYLTDNPIRRRPDITKARSELGYEPAVKLEEGLRRSLLWYAGVRPGGRR